MKRLLILAAATLAATASLTLPALADGGRSIHGTVASVSADAIAVSGRGGVVTTCALGKRSPSLAGVAVGDRVLAVCARRARTGLTLVRLRKDNRPATTARDTEPVKFGGAITALDGTSISLHDGDRDLTCTLGPTSPSTDGFKVGQHVKAVCAGGVLVGLAALTAADAGRYFAGTVASVTDTTLTLQTEHGAVSCTITPASPSVASLKVGDPIGMGCRATTMELVLLRPLGGDEPAPPTTTTTTTTETPPTPTPEGQTEVKARGTLLTVGDAGVGVQTDGGVVSCTRDGSSPSLDGFSTGDSVSIECLDGALREIEHVDATS